jgi:Protein of unknown function (DUF2637)
MNDRPPATGPRSPDPVPGLRVVALIAAVLGVLVLAAAAFVLSYPGIHQLARTAGMPVSLARVFPVIFDALLVVSIAAVLSLHGAGWWRRGYSWLVTLLLLAAMAAGDVLHVLHTHIPRRPAAVTAAVLPWVLLLIAVTLLLAMLRQFRQARLAATGPAADQAAPAVRTFEPRVGLDGLFPPDPAPVPPEPVPATVHTSTVPITRPVPARPGPAVQLARTPEPGTSASTAPANGKATSSAPADGKPTSTAAADGKPASSAPSDAEPTSTGPVGTTPADATPAGTGPAAEPAAAGPDERAQEETGPGETGPEAGEPAASPGGGAIHVPEQPVRAPVPAPAPHFDRLRSTPTPPDDDTGT